MAGKRRQNDILRALDQLAREHMPADDGEEPAEALDYVLDWVGQGKTMTSLAPVVSAVIGYVVNPPLLYRALRSRTPNATELIQQRRAEDAAHSLVDEAQDLLDEPAVTREQLQRAKQRAEFRQWRAKVLAPNDYGERKQVDININLPAAHLMALQRINAQRVMKVQASALEGGEVTQLGRARDPSAALIASEVREIEGEIEVLAEEV